ncbi:MAG: hypothetical protein Fur0010_26150 [Bdellovibrio sp.]
MNVGATVIMNDRDLAGLVLSEVPEISTEINPDKIEVHNLNSSQTEINLYIEKNGTRNFVPLPKNSFVCQAQSKVFQTSLQLDPYFEIRSKKVYQLKATVECGKKNDLIFKHDSTSGEAIGIWHIANLAVQKFHDIDRINFWKKKITINWPSNGDYYSFNSVHLTKGHFWDVVGHELGHAIYDQAKIGVFGGGSHKIDECYSHALALSEGWASFFSAWLSIDLKDPDAKFEYMVPRRAPLRIEQIPEDVCKSEKNEWRVTGWLWDLVDLSADQEQIEKNFTSFWDFTINKNFKKTSDIAKALISRGHSQLEMEEVWQLNFLDDLK